MMALLHVGVQLLVLRADDEADDGVG